MAYMAKSLKFSGEYVAGASNKRVELFLVFINNNRYHHHHHHHHAIGLTIYMQDSVIRLKRIYVVIYFKVVRTFFTPLLQKFTN